MKKLTFIMLAFLFAFSCGALSACDTPAETGPQPVSVLSGWQDGDDEVYTVSTVSGKTQMVYDRGTGLDYPFAKRLLAEADKLGSMETLVFTARATVTDGTYTAMLKLEGTEGLIPAGASPEVWFYLTEIYTTYEWDLSAFDLTKATRLLLFMNPDAFGGTGTVLIKEAEFVVRAADPDLKPELPSYTAQTVTANTYTSGDEFTVKNFGDNGDGVYKITNDGNSAIINYSKPSSKNKYSAFKALVKGAGLANMKAFEVKIQGIAGTNVIIKPYDSWMAEKTFNFTGGEDVFKVDLRGVNPKPDFTNEIPMIFMVEGGNVAVSGKVKLISAKLTKEDIPASFDHFDKFEALPALTEDTVAPKTMFAMLDLKGKDIADMVITAKAALGDTLEIELGDVDATLTPLPVITLGSAEAETEILDVSGVAFTGSKLAKLTITYSGDKPEISALYFTPVSIIKLIGNGGTVIEEDMFCNVSIDSRFAFDYTVVGKVIATYTGHSWDAMVAYVDFGDGGYDAVAMKIQGVADATAIINIGGQEAKFEDPKLTGLEQTVTFNAAQLEAIKGLKGIQVIRIYVDMKSSSGSTRTFTISQFDITKA